MACGSCRKRRFGAIPSLVWDSAAAEACVTVQVRRTVHIALPSLSRVFAAGDIACLPFSVVRTLLAADPPFVHFTNDVDRDRYYAWLP